MKKEILAILEMEIKNEEKAEMIAKIIAEAYNDGTYDCDKGVGHDNGLEYVKAIW